MNRTEFVEKYNNIVEKALASANKARSNGILALEDDLDHEKVDGRDIFEYGLRFVVDGTDRSYIEEILSNIINQEKDDQLRTLMNIQKKAVLSIQAGDNLPLSFSFIISCIIGSSSSERSVKEFNLYARILVLSPACTERTVSSFIIISLRAYLSFS